MSSGREIVYNDGVSHALVDRISSGELVCNRQYELIWVIPAIGSIGECHT